MKGPKITIVIGSSPLEELQSIVGEEEVEEVTEEVPATRAAMYKSKYCPTVEEEE